MRKTSLIHVAATLALLLVGVGACDDERKGRAPVEGGVGGTGGAEPEPLNAAPVADAGADQVVPLGSEVELNGRASSDPDGDPLTFHWAFTTLPEGSEASLHDPRSRTPRFLADRAGIYEVELVVDDGSLTATDSVMIRANRAPSADAGGDRSGVVGEAITLDGSASADPDGDPLTHTWSFITLPAGSTATFVEAAGALATFTPDQVGRYVAALEVSDGFATATDRIEVEVVPATGILGSVLYVSPQGDDDDLGAEDAPLATLGVAVERARQNADIRRIQLDPGIYTEDFELEIDRDVTIVGSESEDDPSILLASGRIFEVVDGARLSLLGLSLRTRGIAIRTVGADVDLNRVRCESQRCIQAGMLAVGPAGSVTVRASRLQGTENPASGISILGGPGATIIDSTIAGHSAGVSVSGAPILVRGSQFTDCRTGVDLYQLTGDHGARIEDSGFDESLVGISAVFAHNVRIQGSVFSTTRGLEISGSTVFGDDLLFSGIDGEAVVIGEDDFGDGETLTLRNSEFSSIAGPGIAIKGLGSTVDLGNATEPGNNSIHTSYVELLDDRPDDSLGTVTMSQTTLGGDMPPPGAYSGPSFNHHGIAIRGRNQVIVY